MKPGTYVALVHHPVLDRHGKVSTTSFTNLDLHDISRLGLTYGVSAFYAVSPLASQKALFGKLSGFWQQETAGAWQPYRAQAWEICQWADDIDTVISDILTREQENPVVVSTTAAAGKMRLDWSLARTAYQNRTAPWLLLLGTGYGLAESLHERANHILAPINGVGTYNHLSVRTAAAIILDRLVSEE